MNAKKLISGLLLLSLGIVSQTASADFIGIKVGGGIWDYEVSGKIRYLTAADVDLKNDLKLQDEKDSYSFIIIEHPVPLIPNVKVSKSGLATAGSGTLTANFTYGGETYSASESITTELVLDHQDVTLYYELLDNVVTLDVGLTAKMVDGKITITRSGVPTTTPIEGTIPMLYGAVGISFPATGIYVGVEGSALKIGDSEISDYTAKISYETSYLLGIEGGVRTMTVKLDDFDNSSSNMEFSGPFVNLFLHF